MGDNTTGISRRSFLAGTGAAVSGFAAGSILGLNTKKAEAAEGPWPYPFATLDAALVKEKAFDAYFTAGCCYGGAVGLIEGLKAALGSGSVWDDIPTDMFKWGGGGVLSWGTICGALNGVLPVINLVFPEKVGAFADNILGWYSGHNFPDTSDTAFNTYVDNFVAGKGWTLDTITPTISDSPLCHVSVSTWCGANNKATGSNEKKVRCARLTAETAAYAAELLNAYYADKVNNVPVGANFDTNTQDCMGCHNGSSSTYDDEQGKMTCGECHSDTNTESYKNIAPAKCTNG